MTNFRNHDNLIADGDTRGARLAADFTDLFAASVPDLKFHFPAPLARSERHMVREFRTVGIAAGIVGVALAVTLVAAFVAPHFLSDQPKVSAAEILAQAAAVAAGETDTPPYHMVSTYQFEPDRDYSEVTEIVTEIWYGGPERYRLEYRSSREPDWSYLYGNVVNGDEAWLYLQNRCGPENRTGDDPRWCDGRLRAVHGPSSELGVAGDSFARPGSLGAVIGAYGPGSCRSAHLQGEDVVLGRTTYVVAITPDADNCPPRGEYEQGIRIESVRDTSETLWVDKETFLILKDESKQREGVGTSSVSQIEVGTEPPDSTFTYEASQGIKIQEVSDINEAKEALGPPLR